MVEAIDYGNGSDNGDDDDWGDWDEPGEIELIKQNSSVDPSIIFTTGKKPYTILDPFKVKEIQAERIAELVDETGFPEDLAFAMLIKNGWNIDHVKEEFSRDIDYVKNTFKCEFVN